MVNIDLVKILDEIEKEKGIPKEVILDAIETSLVSAYKKNFAQGKDNVEVIIDKESGKVQVLSKRTVV